MVSVGFGVGFVVVEENGVALAPDSTSASSSSCRCLALYPPGGAGEEPVSSFRDSSLINRWGPSESFLSLSYVGSGTGGDTGGVGVSSTTLKW